MVLVYGDESLDETEQRVCAVAGVIGSEEKWAKLEANWSARTGGIPFHAKDCDSDHGDFGFTPHGENKSLYKDLTILLAESGLQGFASAYDLLAQRKHFPPPHAPPVYYQPFLEVLGEMLSFADAHRQIAKLTFDSRIESEHNAGLIYAQLRERNPLWKERLADEISFASSRKHPRIQVADLFAREAMKSLDNKIGPTKRAIRKSWQALRDTRRFAIAERSTKYFEAAKSELATLVNLFGFNPDDFQDWLASRKRQRNVTNFLEFLLWYRTQLSPDQVKRLDEYRRRNYDEQPPGPTDR